MPKRIRRALFIVAITAMSQIDRCGGGCGVAPQKLFPAGVSGPLVAAR